MGEGQGGGEGDSQNLRLNTFFSERKRTLLAKKKAERDTSVTPRTKKEKKGHFCHTKPTSVMKSPVLSPHF